MKSYRLLLILILLAFIFGCSKDETMQPLESTTPILKASGCTPAVYNYNTTDTVDVITEPVVIPDACFLDVITLTFYEVTTKGHSNVSASCRFNDHAKLDYHFIGIGMFGSYESYGSIDHHYIGIMDGDELRVSRENISGVVTNTSTGITFTTTMNIFQVINANGDITVSKIEFLPCE